MHPNPPRPVFPYKTVLIIFLIAAVIILFFALFTSLPTEEQKAAPKNQLNLPSSIILRKDSIIEIDSATVEELLQFVTWRYHVPVVYQGKPTDKKAYSGIIVDRFKIEDMLHILQGYGVKISYDGDTITVEK